MESNEEMVVVSRAALEQLQRQIDGLPEVFAKSTQEISRALSVRLSAALDDLAAQLGETTDDALRAIRDAIPVVIAEHAPDIEPSVLDDVVLFLNPGETNERRCRQPVVEADKATG